MLTDEQILLKATLLLEKISKDSDLTTEVLLREISDAEMKGVEAILQKLADNPKGVLAFDELFGRGPISKYLIYRIINSFVVVFPLSFNGNHASFPINVDF